MHEHGPHLRLISAQRHYIGGAWLAPSGDRRFGLADPATGLSVGALAMGDSGEVDMAVQAAAAAFAGGWGTSPIALRIQYLERIAGAVSDRREAFARVISKEIGAPVDFARAHQVETALRHLDATLQAARSMADDGDLATNGQTDAVCYVPVGVAALITPWNWPLNQVVLKVAGAIAAGCTMVLKPSELSSLTAMLFAECVEEAGLPSGVFNLVLGDGAVTGAALCAHPAVGAISFTGSTAVGVAVAAIATERMKRVTLELGGKSANLVFADCDLETAIRQGVAHCFRNTGQSCNAASRMLVERSVYDRAIALAATAAKATRIDAPHIAGAHIGPLISQRQHDRVQALIGSALEQGARLIAGGRGYPETGLAEADLHGGFYCRATVFADVTSTMEIFQQEVFGPVLCMTPFDTEDDAVALANATRYGLAAFIQTRDRQCAVRVSRRLQAGMIQINGASRLQGAPFGGVKQSGVGREAGVWGIRAFQEVVSVSGIPG